MRLDLDRLLPLASPSLRARWRALASLLPTRRQTPAEWNEAFTNFLDAAGWPGPRAIDSEEFQAMTRWREVLVDFSRLERVLRSEEHTSELQSLMRISYAVFCLKKNNTTTLHRT